MIRITDEDLKKGYAAVQGNESVTWHKVLERLDNGDELCLAIGYGEGFDEPTICAKIGVLAGNSAMSEYAWDFVMPYDPETGDVWDTEISIGSEGGDADWLNSQAEEVLALLNKGEYVTSGCHGKSKKKEDKKKKPVKSSFEFTDSFADQSGNWKQYKVMDKETLDKIKGYLDFKDDELQLGNVFVNVVFDSSTGELLGGQVVDTESSSWDLSAIECREIMGRMIESARKTIKSGMSYEQALADFTSMGKPWGDYWSMQQDWTAYVDSLTRDGEVDYEESRWWDNPCTPETFREWINSSTSKKRKWKHPDEVAKDNGADITCSKHLKSSKKSIQSMARGYLEPGYDSRASFYNKAVTDDNKLYSYGTLVADIVDGQPVLYPDWNYSQTTIRHVREWLRQHGFEAGSKSEIAAMYPVQNSRKPVKSAMQISEIHNNTSNLYARIVYCDLESDVTEFEEEELIPIYDFKEQLRNYAESMNGWYTVTHRDDGYEPAEYYVTFTNGESKDNDPDSPDYDPYFENELGSIKFELVCDAGDELCNYLQS